MLWVWVKRDLRRGFQARLTSRVRLRDTVAGHVGKPSAQN